MSLEIKEFVGHKPKEVKNTQKDLKKNSKKNTKK